MNTLHTNSIIMALFTFIGTVAAALGISYVIDLLTKQPFSLCDPVLLIGAGIIAAIPALAVFSHPNMQENNHSI